MFDHYFELGMPEEKSPFLKSESRSWGRNLSLKGALLASVLLLTSFILSFYPHTAPLSYAILASVYFFAGVPSLIESIEDLLEFDINIDILMTLAAFSSIFIGSGFEGALLLVLFSLSGSLEDMVQSKATSAINALHKLSPTMATVVEPDGKLIERSIKEIIPGAKILVKSGQIVPLDGFVISGETSVNLVHLTGENFPITKVPGDEVASGARNLEGSITLEVTKTSSDSSLAKIIQLVTEAQEAKPQLQSLFDSLSRSYALTIIALSIFFTLLFPLVLNIPLLGQGGSLYRSLAFLIAASPCALIIAIPTAYLSALSACAKQGILMKGGITLDRLAGCTVLAFDKTGTLTTGDLSLVEVISLSDELDEKKALQIAYAMEKGAVHPIAKALMQKGEEEQIAPVEIQDFKAIPGWGLEGKFEGKEVYIGNPNYVMDKFDLQTKELLKKQSQSIRDSGELLALLVVAGKPSLFRFRDTPRKEIKKTIDELQNKWNMTCLMLTGDHAATAKKIADELGIKFWKADLRPEDKLKVITELSREKHLAMIGDGINDAPALARATVGICMGKVGTTAAMDASDIILLQDNIENLGWLVAKAKKTRKIVAQNLTLATFAMIFASLPALAGLIPLWLAVILHEGGTVLVGLNALRLLKK